MTGAHTHPHSHRPGRPIGRRGHAVRLGAALGVTGLLAVVLPWSPASANEKKPEPGFAGYSTSAIASPVKIEVYEPTIPIPAVPQVELSMGYSTVSADSSSSRARSSFFWPGGTLGEGFSTMMEQLGLPKELGEGGYPVQVNALSPAGPTTAKDEPFPGMIQRAEAGENTAIASNGFSTDGNAKDESDEDGGDSPLPGLPGLPELPGLPLGNSTGNNTGGIFGALDQLLNQDRAAAADTPGVPGLPPELAALVDLGGFSSVSKTNNGDVAFAQARASLGDVSILGGLITIEGVKTVARAKSDGAVGDPHGEAVYGDLVAFGQRFKFGSDGYEAVGQKGTIPGLPDDAVKAMQKLGLTISLPKATTTRDGDAATATTPGIVIDFDLTALRKQLTPVTDLLNQVLGQLPAELAQLTNVLQAAVNLSPRIVFTLGSATAAVDTSPPIEIPPVDDPTEEPTESEPTEQPPASNNDAPGPGPSVDEAPPTNDAPPSDDVSDAAILPASATPGLPKLFSIPGLLLLGGFLLAALAGLYVRAIGAAALGAGATCSHGLASGLPDLRKVK